ncbi:hypothetical protein [Caldicellulosiruptor sp. DIB 104C]|uniref:hypothetical protein n=1 Tax=Caldicellulosiruptor sp. DIB 104C TaxID=3019889 RepID=UPI002304EBDE|nr:hypothetical protein [Caldicellulosiruptor sp. DIB 104C]
MKLIGKIFEVFFKYFILVPAFIGFISGTILSIINKSFGGLLLMLSVIIVYLFLPELALLVGRYGFEEVWKQIGIYTKPDFIRPWKLTKIVLLTSCCTAVIISILKIIETKNFFYLFGIPISGLLFYLVLIADNLINRVIYNKKS